MVLTKTLNIEGFNLSAQGALWISMVKLKDLIQDVFLRALQPQEQLWSTFLFKNMDKLSIGVQILIEMFGEQQGERKQELKTHDERKTKRSVEPISNRI